MSKVSVVKCPDYDYDNVKIAVDRSIRLAGGLKISKGDNVLLKINLLKANDPEVAITTHPSVVRAVSEHIMDQGATPIVGDTQNIQMDKGLHSLEVCGIRGVCDDLGIKALDFKKNGYVEIDIPKAMQMKNLWIAKDLLDADVVISLPKMKTHILTGYTGAVKNFFGCIPFGERMKAHILGKDDFSEVLSDIYSVSNPSFCIMDGIDGMEGNGPSHGEKKHFGIIAAGSDCVSVDAICSSLMGFETIGTITAAQKRSLGVGDLSKIDLVGDKISPFNIKMPAYNIQKSQNLTRFIPKPIKSYISKTLLKFEPRVDISKCKSCGICKKVCPPHAISFDRYPVFDREKCIRCFCCHELCPDGAIYTYKSWLARRWR